MLIAQLSDLHITDDEAEGHRFVDAGAKLAAAIEYLHGRAVPPDAVVVTGDLTDHGSPTEFAILLDLLRPLRLPTYLIPGNHDEHDTFRAAFGDCPWMPSPGPINYAVEHHAVRLVAFDSTMPGRHDGEVDSARLAWLDDTLRSRPETLTFVFLHHPPFRTGLWMMDEMGLTGAADLRAVIARHPQVRHIAAGHVHRSVSTMWGTTKLTTAPSTCHQVRCDLDPREGAAITDEAPMLQLHHWNGDGVVTNTTPFEPPSRTIDLSKVTRDWAATRARILSGPPFPKGSDGFS